jgi:hypothetical protein
VSDASDTPRSESHGEPSGEPGSEPVGRSSPVSSTDPKERVLEVALAELLRVGAAPDYAARVRARWEAARDAARPARLGRRAASPAANRSQPSSVAPRPWWSRPPVAVAASAAAAALAVIAWRVLADGPAAPPGPPPDRFVAFVPDPAGARSAGLELAPASFGAVLLNPRPESRELVLHGGGRVRLESGAVLALIEDGGPPRARLLDGRAGLTAPIDGPAVLFVANSPAPLEVEPGGTFVAEVARAAGPHPVDHASRAAAEDPPSFGLGELLGPTWLIVEPGDGALTWGAVDGTRIAVAERLEGEVLDAEGRTRVLSADRRDDLAKLLAYVAPVPGIDELPDWMAVEVGYPYEAEDELVRQLTKSPALWIPVGRALRERVAAHGEPRWWEGALAVVSRVPGEAAERVARDLWATDPERFDTDALLALAERGVQPFDRELDVLLAALPTNIEDAALPSVPGLPMVGPDRDPGLLALAALARGDRRFTGIALTRAEGLAKVLDGAEPGSDMLPALLAAGVLALDGAGDVWRDATRALAAVVASRLGAGELDSAARLAGTVDAIAFGLGLPPYTRDDGDVPRLAYAARRARELAGRFGRADAVAPPLPATLEEWLVVWRRH